MKTGSWVERHPLKALALMKSLGLESFTDELRCPDCGQILKPEGVELTGLHGCIYSNHFGSMKCRWQKELGVQISGVQSHRFSLLASRCDIRRNTPLAERPLCGCGCGGRVDYSSINSRWNIFVSTHRRHLQVRGVFHRMVEQGIDNQVDLRRLTRDGSSRYASRLAVGMERLGLIKREKILVNGGWSYRFIVLRNDKVL